MNLGFNLAGSLAAIDQWVQDMSSGDDDEADKPVHANSLNSANSNSTTTATSNRPMSREAIFSLVSALLRSSV
jgi:hypothetical protein